MRNYHAGYIVLDTTKYMDRLYAPVITGLLDRHEE